MERLILDTSVIVAAERERSALDAIGDSDDVAIAAITAAELLVGVEGADAKHREARDRFVSALLGAVTIEPYDLDVARAHASLLAHTRRAGTARGAHDLIIAATARTHQRTLLTLDGPGFADLPGVRLATAS